MRRAPREEEAILVYAADGSLLAHYEERYNKIYEDLPQLSGVSKPNSHSPIKFA